MVYFTALYCFYYGLYIGFIVKINNNVVKTVTLNEYILLIR